MTTPFDYAAQCIARCYAGFQNEFAHAAWAKRERPKIDALPIPLRKKVWLAWDQATAVEFSKKVER